MWGYLAGLSISLPRRNTWHRYVKWTDIKCNVAWCSRLNNGPQLYPHPNPWNFLVNVTLHGKRDSANENKQRIFRWGNYPTLPKWDQRNYKDPYHKEVNGDLTQKKRRRCEHGNRDWSDLLCRQEGATSQGIQVRTRRFEKGKETNSPLDPQETTSPANTLTLAQWNFSPPELWDNKFMLFEAT